MATATAAACPRCNSEMWDNTRDKRSPTSPDFRCKNSSCGGAIWLDGRGPRRAGPARAAAATNGNGRRPVPQQTELAPQNGDGGHAEPGEDPDAAFLAAWRVYRQCLGSVIAHVAPKLSDTGFKVSAQDVLSATATLFTATTRGR